MELFSHIFSQIEHCFFWLEIFFAIEIKSKTFLSGKRP